jgi:hypothetical protein
MADSIRRCLVGLAGTKLSSRRETRLAVSGSIIADAARLTDETDPTASLVSDIVSAMPAAASASEGNVCGFVPAGL